MPQTAFHGAMWPKPTTRNTGLQYQYLRSTRETSQSRPRALNRRAQFQPREGDIPGIHGSHQSPSSLGPHARSVHVQRRPLDGHEPYSASPDTSSISATASSMAQNTAELPLHTRSYPSGGQQYFLPSREESPTLARSCPPSGCITSLSSKDEESLLEAEPSPSFMDEISGIVRRELQSSMRELQQDLQCDIAQVWELQQDLQSEIAQVSKEGVADVLAELRNVAHASVSNVDFLRLLEELRSSTKLLQERLDTSPAVQAIERIRAEMDIDFSWMLEAINKVPQTIQESARSKNLDEDIRTDQKIQSESSLITTAIRPADISLVVEPSPEISGSEELRSEMDALRTLHETSRRVEVDFSPILDVINGLSEELKISLNKQQQTGLNMQGMRTASTMEHGGPELAPVCERIYERVGQEAVEVALPSASVDFTPVLEMVHELPLFIENSISRLDCVEDVNAVLIEVGQIRHDNSDVLKVLMELAAGMYSLNTAIGVIRSCVDGRGDQQVVQVT